MSTTPETLLTEYVARDNPSRVAEQVAKSNEKLVTVLDRVAHALDETGRHADKLDRVSTASDQLRSVVGNLVAGFVALNVAQRALDFTAKAEEAASAFITLKLA